MTKSTAKMDKGGKFVRPPQDYSKVRTMSRKNVIPSPGQAPKTSDVRFYWMFVSADLCRTFLGSVDKKRPVRKSHVANLSEAMVNGTFYGDVATIKFVGDEETGHMRDGVHRCMAGAQSGVGFWSWVGYGYTDEMIAVTDGGIKRTPGDVLGFYDFEDTAMLAATLRWLLSFKRGYLDTSGYRRPASDQLIPYAFKHSKQLYPIMASHRKPVHLTGSFLSAIAYMGGTLMNQYERTKSFCDAFLYGFTDGVYYNDPNTNPAIQWFTRLQREHKDGRRFVEAVKAARTIQAFNAYLAGEPSPSFNTPIERVTIKGLNTDKI